MIAVKVELESLILQVFNHRNVSLFKVSDTEFKHFDLKSELLDEAPFSISEKRVHLGLLKSVLVSREDSFEECDQADFATVELGFSIMIDRIYLFSKQLCDRVMKRVKAEMQLTSCIAVLLTDEDFGSIFKHHIRGLT